MGRQAAKRGVSPPQHRVQRTNLADPGPVQAAKPALIGDRNTSAAVGEPEEHLWVGACEPGSLRTGASQETK